MIKMDKIEDIKEHVRCGQAMYDIIKGKDYHTFVKLGIIEHLKKRVYMDQNKYEGDYNKKKNEKEKK